MQPSSTVSLRVLDEEQPLLNGLDHTRIPQHIAIIMDGNGRWAKTHGLSVQEGYRAGKAALQRTLEACGDLGIGYLTVFAFSTENWRRPPQEVEFLLKLLERAIDEEFAKLVREGVRVRVIGRMDARVPKSLQEKIAHIVEITRKNKRLIFTVALNYGGRAEIVDAARRVALEAAAGRLDPQTITEENFHNFLYTNGTPDPELVIRTGGDLRLSNFLLWQLAYAEFYSTPLYWPDFNKRELLRAITAYQQRERRFGGRCGDYQSHAR
ncbi:di-trans,poly-cis-decaprenylcistransferase [Candidatus Acetothermia bacterium]|jgi:undecaprenyl diphosphate synthase|nr:di-trans,poly-cis-decaprenylcistransferase [Candidatus Acetothermia bacterium]MCI2431037.1 di-trans,poly-cis-decaprenylcistransferase [Candidatus Acetothermia bacterium]MCI2436933.1 di-trans,poly-cis-decaprenylcistransferase [Candidatus Acetothermia bacterium]